MQLGNKTIVVTGVSSGIGAELAAFIVRILLRPVARSFFADALL